MKQILMMIASVVLKVLVKQVSPMLRQELIKLIKALEHKAAGTPNQFDDELVQMLKKVLGID